MLVARSPDHRLILLSMNQRSEKEWMPRRLFRFEANWSLEEECEEVIKKVWQMGSIVGELP